MGSLLSCFSVVSLEEGGGLVSLPKLSRYLRQRQPVIIFPMSCCFLCWIIIPMAAGVSGKTISQFGTWVTQPGDLS